MSLGTPWCALLVVFLYICVTGMIGLRRFGDGYHDLPTSLLPREDSPICFIILLRKFGSQIVPHGIDRVPVPCLQQLDRFGFG